MYQWRSSYKIASYFDQQHLGEACEKDDSQEYWVPSDAFENIKVVTNGPRVEFVENL